MSCDEREVQAYRTETELRNFYAKSSSCNMKYSLKKGDGVKADVCPPVNVMKVGTGKRLILSNHPPAHSMRTGIL